MKKFFLCTLILAMLCGCNKSTEEKVEDKALTDAVYQDFLQDYFADENHKSDYTSTSNPYTFNDGKEADITLITKQLGCEAINEDLIDEINDIHQEDVNEFKTLLQSFQPVLDESISFNNNNVIIMLKSGTNILYIANDNTIKLVYNDNRCTMKINDHELESFITFLQDNLDSYTDLGLCK